MRGCLVTAVRKQLSAFDESVESPASLQISFWHWKKSVGLQLDENSRLPHNFRNRSGSLSILREVYPDKKRAPAAVNDSDCALVRKNCWVRTHHVSDEARNMGLID